jgi:hypothetical protein
LPHARASRSSTAGAWNSHGTAPPRIDDAAMELPPAPQRAVASIDGRHIKVLAPP